MTVENSAAFAVKLAGDVGECEAVVRFLVEGVKL